MPTPEQIQEKWNKLQEQANALIIKMAQAAVDQIRKVLLLSKPLSAQRPESDSRFDQVLLASLGEPRTQRLIAKPSCRAVSSPL